MTRPFRFAVQAYHAESAGQWRETALRAEALGYSTLHLADHFLGPGPALEATNHPQQGLAAVPAMAMAAEATTRLRIGSRVLCIDYRPAAVLAMEATTLDLLSEGRLELGLGAGWLRGEYEAAGLRFDPAGTRIDRLEETVRAFKLFCSGEPLSIEGEHVRWQGFSGIPRPVQRPHPPLMIGGGSRRVLELAAREAQVVSLNFNNRSGVIGADGMHSGSAEATQRKVDWVRAAAGSRNESLEIEIGAYFTFVGDAVAGIAEQMAKGLGLSTEDMLAHPHALFGSVDGICEELQRRRERFGISYLTVGAEAIEAFAPVVARLDGQ